MSASSATAMYLTHYLESLENLPVELQRNFSLMRDLDSKSQATMQEIDRLGNEIFSKGPSLSPERKREIKIKVSKLFTKSKALGDDKVQLALQTYELVDKHIRRLDSDLARFETEIKNGGTGSGVIGGLVSSGGGVGGGGSSVPNSPLVSEESEFVAAPTVSSSTSNKKRGRKRDKDTMMMSSGTTTTGKNNRLKSLAAEAGALGSRSGSGSGSESPARKKHRSGASGGGAGAGSSGTSSSEIQLAAIAAAGVLPSNSASDTSLDMPVDPNEPTYCICQQVSYGEMIACDNPDCPIEWFHMSCMGIVTSPKGKWFCPKCTPNPPAPSGGTGIKKK